MASRAVGIIVFILALNASGVMLHQSGWAGSVGIECPGTGTSVDQIDAPSTGDNGLVGAGLAAIQSMGDFLILAPVDRGASCVGLPGWMSGTLINLIVRPLYVLALIQLYRGVLLE